MFFQTPQSDVNQTGSQFTSCENSLLEVQGDWVKRKI